MPRKSAALLPPTAALLEQLGERLRLARLRRRLPAIRVASRAGMAPMTLRGVERGGSGVTIGAYLAVMQALGIEQDLALVAQADPVGRSLQDARLPDARRMTRARQPPRGAAVTPKEPAAPRSGESPAAWSGGFTSGRALSALIDGKGLASRRKRRSSR